VVDTPFSHGSELMSIPTDRSRHAIKAGIKAEVDAYGRTESGPDHFRSSTHFTHSVSPQL
jgi:hypothetical protein